MGKLQIEPLRELVESLNPGGNIMLSVSSHISFYRGGVVQVWLTDAFFATVLEAAMDLPAQEITGKESECQLFEPLFYYAQKLHGTGDFSHRLSTGQKKALLKLFILTLYPQSKAECEKAAKDSYKVFALAPCSECVSRIISNLNF